MAYRILTAKTVITGDELKPENGYGILIHNSVIGEIAPIEALKKKCPNAPISDYREATILPGLIDCHTHLDWDCLIPNYVNESQGTESRLTLIGIEGMRRDLLSGVTSARYMGGHYYLDVQFREYVDKGYVKGPKVKAAGLGMRSSAGHGFLGIAADGEQQIISQVRENLLHGVDWMKFYSTGSHLNPSSFPSSFYTRHETELIIDMAHRCGIPATSHCVGGPGMTDAIEAGIDCLEHCYFVEDSHIEQMLKRGTHVCLTMSEYFTIKEHMPSAMAAKFEKYRPIVHMAMEKLIKSGVPYVLGTDGMHGHLWEEGKYLVEHGGTPRDAVRALTVDAAKLIKTDHQVGSLDAGKMADILVVDGNPLSDVSALSKVIAVWQNGTLITA